MGAIDIINYLLGGFLISLGFLINKSPNLIAGYNTMSKDDKANFDIIGFKQVLKSTLIGNGIFIIMGTLIFYFISWDVGKIFVTILPGSILPLYLVYKSKEYYKGKTNKSKNNYLVAAFNFVFLTVTACFFSYAFKEPQVSITNENVQISGLYGFDIPAKDINSFVITDTLPKILLRTNGLGLGNIKKGNFKLENYGLCKLFLQVSNTPYLKIVYSNDKLVYLNFKDKGKTTQLYNKLLSVKNISGTEK